MRDRWLATAEVIDAFRIVPRLLAAIYAVACWQVAGWFMGLEDPNGAQSTFVSVIWGGAAAWFGVYASTGRRWTAQDSAPPAWRWSGQPAGPPPMPPSVYGRTPR